MLVPSKDVPAPTYERGTEFDSSATKSARASVPRSALLRSGAGQDGTVLKTCRVLVYGEGPLRSQTHSLAIVSDSTATQSRRKGGRPANAKASHGPRNCLTVGLLGPCYTGGREFSISKSHKQISIFAKYTVQTEICLQLEISTMSTCDWLKLTNHKSKLGGHPLRDMLKEMTWRHSHQHIASKRQGS